MTPLAITMGDPCGIGPEITLRACADPRRTAPVVVIGDLRVLARADDEVVGTRLALRPITSVDRAEHTPGTVDVIAGSGLPHGLPDDLPWGDSRRPRGRGGLPVRPPRHPARPERRRTRAGDRPINKEALRLGGVPHLGHTEMPAELSGTTDYAMMMANDELRLVLVTVHQSLRTALDAIDTERELGIIRLTHRTLRRGGLPAPRIAVAGLNPHAGENGLFGREDLDVIAPAIRAARDEGILADGPLPADTVFMRACAGEFDAVVAQYHDQGLIPVKYLGLERGVNITIGLPFVRTGVDHGTAFDIAGTGRADHTSLLTALHHADQLSSAAADRR